MTERWARLLRLDDLAPGTSRTVRLAGRSIVVANVGGEVHALDATCPHAGGDIGQGSVDGGQVVCPLHGSRFDARSGAVMRGPATNPLRVYKVRLAEGWIEVSA